MSKSLPYIFINSFHCFSDSQKFEFHKKVRKKGISALNSDLPLFFLSILIFFKWVIPPNHLLRYFGTSSSIPKSQFIGLANVDINLVSSFMNNWNYAVVNLIHVLWLSVILHELEVLTYLWYYDHLRVVLATNLFSISLYVNRISLCTLLTFFLEIVKICIPNQKSIILLLLRQSKSLSIMGNKVRKFSSQFTGLWYWNS